MLRDARQIAIDEVVVACRESIDQYDDAAEHVDGEALAPLFIEIATARRKIVRQLESCQRAAGELPRAPDSEREAIQQLFTRAKAALVEDGCQVFLQALLEHETHLDKRLLEARGMDHQHEVKTCLEALLSSIDDARTRLAAASEPTQG